jgi:hypothetical protein
VVTHEPFQIGCGELDEGLKEVALFAAVSSRIPESFEDFVAFPPVGEIVEVNPVPVVVRLSPLFRWKDRRSVPLLSVRMALRVMERV